MDICVYIFNYYSSFLYYYLCSLLSPQAENEEVVTDAKVQYKNAILRAGKVSPNERLIHVFENNRCSEELEEPEPLQVSLTLLYIHSI